MQPDLIAHAFGQELVQLSLIELATCQLADFGK